MELIEATFCSSFPNSRYALKQIKIISLDIQNTHSLNQLSSFTSNGISGTSGEIPKFRAGTYFISSFFKNCVFFY